MKELAPKFLTALSLALLFLVGCDWLLRTSDFASLLLGSGAHWPDWHSLLAWWQQWIVTLALILLPILTTLSWLIMARDNSIRTVTASGDVIRLAPSAVERIVNREVRNNVPEVVRLGATARQGKKGPSVVVNVATTDKVPVPKVDADVRRETVKVLQHLLGVGDPSEVKVIIYDVQSPSARGSAKRRRAAEDDDFTAKEDKPPAAEKAKEPEKPKTQPPPPKPVEPEKPKQPPPPAPKPFSQEKGKTDGDKPKTPIITPPPPPPKAVDKDATKDAGLPFDFAKALDEEAGAKPSADSDAGKTPPPKKP